MVRKKRISEEDQIVDELEEVEAEVDQENLAGGRRVIRKKIEDEDNSDFYEDDEEEYEDDEEAEEEYEDEEEHENDEVNEDEISEDDENSEDSEEDEDDDSSEEDEDDVDDEETDEESSPKIKKVQQPKKVMTTTIEKKAAAPVTPADEKLDEVSVEEATNILQRTEMRVKKLCREEFEPAGLARKENGRWMIQRSALEEHARSQDKYNITMDEAKKLLNLSEEEINTLVKDNKLYTQEVDGKMLFAKRSLNFYQKNQPK